MKVEVHLFATLSGYLPDGTTGDGFALDVPEGSTVADVLRALGIGRIDLYGDSYGTFFSQTFAVRHPSFLRSVVLDSAYFVQWPDPWYSDTNRAMDAAFRLACERWPTPWVCPCCPPTSTR